MINKKEERTKENSYMIHVEREEKTFKSRDEWQQAETPAASLRQRAQPFPKSVNALDATVSDALDIKAVWRNPETIHFSEANISTS